MAFLDLTPTWTDRPLTDPSHAADVVDLFVSQGDRHRGTLVAILCDPDAHFRASISLELPGEFTHLTEDLDPPAGCHANTRQLCFTAMDPVIPAVQTAPGTRLLLALGRPGPRTCPDLDTDWATAANAICRAADVPLLGFYIATANHIYQPTPASAVAA
ncbi:hypothetical protein HPO96_34885 [Kribbella sandramycini]|nr:hypothetical protein [Kribbella sandramycini]NOL45448.1 hypothetical protein [Kribbella sandramycini]